MYSIDYLNKAINYYFVEKLSFNKISKKLKISRQIISIWIKKFINDISFLTNRNKIKINKHPIKLYNIDLQLLIKNIIYENPFITRKHIINIVYSKLNIKLTLNNVSKIYKILKLTRKKPKYHIIKNYKYIEELIDKRKNFYEHIKNENINKIISIDESGFNNLIPNNLGLSDKGKHINIPINLKQKQHKNITLLMAINTNGILNSTLEIDKINGIKFFEFIKNTISLLTDTNYIFIFDNVSFHHNKEMLKIIIESGNKYFFTPPYSPNNNPIETIFSIIKNKYNKLKCTFKNFNIKNEIKNIIIQFKSEYDDIKKIFIKSLSFNYNNIEKELIDRIIFVK
jgi:transposase/predicted DNA-binding protein YlxM (UPF0122 family)